MATKAAKKPARGITPVELTTEQIKARALVRMETTALEIFKANAAKNKASKAEDTGRKELLKAMQEAHIEQFDFVADDTHLYARMGAGNDRRSISVPRLLKQATHEELIAIITASPPSVAAVEGVLGTAIAATVTESIPGSVNSFVQPKPFA